MVGDAGDTVWYPDAVYTLTPSTAVQIIENGHTAVIPYKDWKQTARYVLAHLGCDDGWVQNRIHFAEIGQLQ
jgi:hypothetical protein